MTDRIDVHHHLVPAAWRTAVRDALPDPAMWPALPGWSVAEAIAVMDGHGVATSVVSVSAPGVVLRDSRAGDARDLAAAVNDVAAEVVKDRPDRFGFFASVPVLDMDDALAETARSLDELHADGVVLMSSVRGRYLGDPAYEPLWAELDRRGAVVFVHPNQPGIPALDGTPFPLVDFPFDTTRTAVHMTLRGIPRRYPRAKVILSHGGGFLPYAAHRFAALAPEQVDASLTPQGVLEDLRWFHVDTALSASPASLPALRAFFGPGHVLYGSDWPFAPAPVGAYFDRYLESEATPDEHAEISRGAAERLFPRLARAKA
jgi:predicted TIM-barrel fold metal-dependent hydrolase